MAACSKKQMSEGRKTATPTAVSRGAVPRLPERLVNSETFLFICLFLFKCVIIETPVSEGLKAFVSDSPKEKKVLVHERLFQ